MAWRVRVSRSTFQGEQWSREATTVNTLLSPLPAGSLCSASSANTHAVSRLLMAVLRDSPGRGQCGSHVWRRAAAMGPLVPRGVMASARSPAGGSPVPSRSIDRVGGPEYHGRRGALLPGQWG